MIQVVMVVCRLFVAKSPELFTYDADGNMLTDGRFRYTWNAENRLIRAQELYAPTNRNPYTVTYAYDHRGRMVRKEISRGGAETQRIEYVWDDWNIIREIQVLGVRDQGSGGSLTTNDYPLITDNVWGLDLNGTLQGAGGVGGLLAVIRTDSSTPNFSTPQLYFPTYDANGNVSEYVTTNGEIVAHYDYSPFGETLIESGDLADTFTHRFSTKPWCPVTGFNEYVYRKYRPEIGRWLSRDPIEEMTFETFFLDQTFDLATGNPTTCLYSLYLNDPQNDFDLLGCRGSGSKWRRIIPRFPGKRLKEGGPIEIITIPLEMIRDHYSFEKMLALGEASCTSQYDKHSSSTPEWRLCRCCVIFYDYVRTPSSGDLYFFAGAEVFNKACSDVDRPRYWLPEGRWALYLPW